MVTAFKCCSDVSSCDLKKKREKKVTAMKSLRLSGLTATNKLSFQKGDTLAPLEEQEAVGDET